MRKCPRCGYLLLGDGDTCKHCGAALSLATAMAAPPAAAAPLIAPAPPATEPGRRIWTPPPVIAPPQSPLGAPPPASSMTPPVWRPGPSPVAVRQPQQRSFTARVLAICLSLAMIAGGRFVYGAIAGHSSLPASTSAFAHGNGVTYTDPDGTFTAQFPEQPIVETKDVAVDGGTLSATLVSVSHDNSYEMGVGTMAIALPAGSVDDALKAGTDGFINVANGKILSQTRGMRGDAPTLETRFTVDDGYDAHILVEITHSEMYVLYVHAKEGTDTLYAALDKSFQARA